MAYLCLVRSNSRAPEKSKMVVRRSISRVESVSLFRFDEGTSVVAPLPISIDFSVELAVHQRWLSRLSIICAASDFVGLRIV
jgi:hypothetical protein